MLQMFTLDFVKVDQPACMRMGVEGAQVIGARNRAGTYRNRATWDREGAREHMGMGARPRREREAAAQDLRTGSGRVGIGGMVLAVRALVAHMVLRWAVGFPKTMG